MPRDERPRGYGAIFALIAIGGGAGLVATAMRLKRAIQQTSGRGRAGDTNRRILQAGDGSAADRREAALDSNGTEMADRDGAQHIVHELRSPLARLRTRLAALERRTGDFPHAGEVTMLVAEADHILDLFASLTRLWEIEHGARRVRFAAVDLADVVREVADMLWSVAEDGGDRLIAATSPTAPVFGDVNLLRQLLVNLVENAIRHTPRGTTIMIATASTTNEVRLAVSDDGPGIPTDRHEMVLRRFGRLDVTREGQGLGLTLVDAIVRLHDGALRLENAAPGLRVVIALPAAP
jgi:signal transduction histidine kinase